MIGIINGGEDDQHFLKDCQDREEGIDQGMVLKFLGDSYAKGTFHPKNYSKAAQFYQQALFYYNTKSTEENILKSPEVAVSLGVLYANGQGVLQNETQAIKFLRDAYGDLWHCDPGHVICLNQLMGCLFKFNMSEEKPFDGDLMTIEELSDLMEGIAYGHLNLEMLHQNQMSHVYEMKTIFSPIPILHKPLSEMMNHLEFLIDFLPFLKHPNVLINCIELKRYPIIDLSQGNQTPFLRQSIIGENKYITFDEINVQKVDKFLSFRNTKGEISAADIHGLVAQKLVAQWISRTNHEPECVIGVSFEGKKLNFGDLYSIVKLACHQLEADHLEVFNNIGSPLLETLQNYMLLNTELLPTLIENTVVERNKITGQSKEFQVFDLIKNEQFIRNKPNSK